MYIPQPFKEDDIREIESVIRNNSFALLVSSADGVPVATHIPLLLSTAEKEWKLSGHISKANPQWKTIAPDKEVLAVFQGAHSYISPSWYNHKNVPTWNYQAVHVYGRFHRLEGEKLEQNMKHMMAHFEKAYASKPQGYDEIPEHTLSKDLKGIVAFEMTVTRMEAVSKLSQNRDTESYSQIIAELKKNPSEHTQTIADEMEKRKP